MWGYPLQYPVEPPDPPIVKPPDWFPRPEALGFRTTHVSCARCGVRIPLEEVDWTRFLEEHGQHIRDLLESGRSVGKPVWRPR